MSLTREQILAAPDRKTKEIQTPEWGDGSSVFVRSLTGAEREALEASAMDADKAKKHTRARLCAAFLCDEAASPLFTIADLEELTGKSGVVLDRILEAGLTLNGMREKEAKALEKN